MHKNGNGNDEDDKDVLEAYVALGGAPDKSGGVTVTKVQALAEVRPPTYNVQKLRLVGIRVWHGATENGPLE